MIRALNLKHYFICALSLLALLIGYQYLIDYQHFLHIKIATDNSIKFFMDKGLSVVSLAILVISLASYFMLILKKRALKPTYLKLLSVALVFGIFYWLFLAILSFYNGLSSVAKHPDNLSTYQIITIAVIFIAPLVYLYTKPLYKDIKLS